MALALSKTSASPYYYATGRVRARFGAKEIVRRVRRSTGTGSEKEAERVARQIEAEVIRELEREYRQQQGVDDTTFEEAARAYLMDGNSPRFVEKLLHYFRGQRVAEIKPADIDRAGVDLYPNAKPETRRRQCRVPTKAIINHHLGLRPQKREDNARTIWLGPEEFERLLDAAHKARPALATMCLVLAGCGLRSGEMLVLRTSDVYLPSRLLRVRAEEDGARKTGAARWITLPDRVANALAELVAEREADPRGSDRLFLTPKNQPYVIRDHGGGQIAAAFARAIKAAGLSSDITPHALRHTFATWFYSQTKDTLRLEAEGGWAGPAMVRRYTKLAPPDLPARLDQHGWNFRAVATGAPLRAVK